MELASNGRVSGLLSENALERRPEAQGNAWFITEKIQNGKHCLEWPERKPDSTPCASPEGTGGEIK